MFKKIAIVAALLAISGAAFADDSQQQASTTTSGSTAASVNAGNAQNISFTTPADTTSHVTQTISGTQTVNQNVSGNTYAHESATIRNVPNVSGPNLTTSNDTCLGSISGGAGIPGVGITLGGTREDKNCVLLKNSRELWNMGFRAAALARMCMDPDNKKALTLTGFTCPQDEKKTETAATPVADTK